MFRLFSTTQKTKSDNDYILMDIRSEDLQTACLPIDPHLMKYLLTFMSVQERASISCLNRRWHNSTTTTNMKLMGQYNKRMQREIATFSEPRFEHDLRRSRLILLVFFLFTAGLVSSGVLIDQFDRRLKQVKSDMRNTLLPNNRTCSDLVFANTCHDVGEHPVCNTLCNDFEYYYTAGKITGFSLLISILVEIPTLFLLVYRGHMDMPWRDNKRAERAAVLAINQFSSAFQQQTMDILLAHEPTMDAETVPHLTLKQVQEKLKFFTKNHYVRFDHYIRDNNTSEESPVSRYDAS